MRERERERSTLLLLCRDFNNFSSLIPDTTYLNLFLTGRRRIGGDFGSARREKIPDLLLQITDPMGQSKIIGSKCAKRREGFAFSKDDDLRRVGCNRQQPCQIASPRSHHKFSVHFQDSKHNRFAR